MKKNYWRLFLGTPIMGTPIISPGGITHIHVHEDGEEPNSTVMVDQYETCYSDSHPTVRCKKCEKLLAFKKGTPIFVLLE